jgi:hypothetical protein
MNALQTEICRTKFEIERLEQQLSNMVKDHMVPLWRIIETKRNLKELTAYLRGLQFQTSTGDLRIEGKQEETRA